MRHDRRRDWECTVTIVLRKAAIIAAGNRGRRKAALAIAAARLRPITLARLRDWAGRSSRMTELTCYGGPCAPCT